MARGAWILLLSPTAAAAKLNRETVLPLSDPDEIRAGPERVVPGIDWQDEHVATATVDAGGWSSTCRAARSRR
jgi:hypothetical protein